MKNNATMQIVYLFISLVLFFFVALAITNHVQRKRGNTKERETAPPPIDLSIGCCGAHEVCERANLIKASREKAEQFNDEELDNYVHRTSLEYTEEEAKEFREV